MTKAQREIVKLEIIHDYLERVEKEIHGIRYDWRKTGEKRQAYDFTNKCGLVDEVGNPVMEDVWDEFELDDNAFDEEDVIKLSTLEAIQMKLEELI